MQKMKSTNHIVPDWKKEEKTKYQNNFIQISSQQMAHASITNLTSDILADDKMKQNKIKLKQQEIYMEWIINKKNDLQNEPSNLFR